MIRELQEGTMTATPRQELAAQPQQSNRSVAGTTTGQCDLRPATAGQGRSELGACLTLTAPSGLTEGDRKEWIAVAMQTLSGIPGDLLKEGCEQARKHCKWPNEIVPTIIQTIEAEWERRKTYAENMRLKAEFERRSAVPKIAAPREPRVTPDQMTAILAEFGLKRAPGVEPRA